MNNKGVYKTTKKDNSIYYRVSTVKNDKHISLGSFEDIDLANRCFDEAEKILEDISYTIENYSSNMAISFEKYIMLVNFRDNGIYISNPIYLKNKFFLYFLDKDTVLKFDKDDLFYYLGKKIRKRGNHIFCHEYGMQVNINDRYGIPPYAVEGRDYRFKNGDSFDYRYSNIEIINKYHGVVKKIKKGIEVYEVKIHVNGYLKVGEYKDEVTAAIAYNKACDILSKSESKKYTQNYPDINPKEYAVIYSEVKISSKIQK